MSEKERFRELVELIKENVCEFGFVVKEKKVVEIWCVLEKDMLSLIHI